MKKQTIVILHGWGLSGKMFAPLVGAFGALGYRSVAPDMPGFGSEAAPPYAWKLRDYVNFIEKYLEKRRITNPIFVGHSFGGRVSLKYTQLHPQDVAALVLTGTPGYTPIARKKLFFFILVAKIGRLIFALPPLNLFSDWARRWYYYVVGAKEFFRAEGPMRDTFKNIVQEELVTAMESVTVPCLLLWGEYDIIVPPVIAHHMKEVMPHAVLRIIPEVDHGVPYKDPEKFASYIDTFVSAL